MAVAHGVGQPGTARSVNVNGSRAVTTFASNVDFREGGLLGLGSRAVTLAQLGGLALGALQCAVLVATGPEQGIAVAYPPFRIQMKPPLAAFGLPMPVPGDRQNLVTSA